MADTLQLPFGTTVNVTGSPEVAVALTVSDVPTTCGGMALNVMSWETTVSVSGVVIVIDPDVPVTTML